MPSILNPVGFLNILVPFPLLGFSKTGMLQVSLLGQLWKSMRFSYILPALVYTDCGTTVPPSYRLGSYLPTSVHGINLVRKR